MTGSRLTSRRRASVLAIAVSAGAVCAACGGAGSQSGAQSRTPRLESSFITRANALCAPPLAVQRAHPFPLASFDPEHPQPDALPTVGTYFRRYGAASDVAAGLVALGSPVHAAADWQRMITMVKAVARNASAQNSAAEQHDASEFTRTVHVAVSLAASIRTLGGELGFKGDSPCARFYG